MPFTSISWLHALCKISSIILKRNGDYGYLRDLVLFCSWMKNIEHFISKYIDWCGIFAGIIYQNEDPHFCSYFLKQFFKRRIVSSSRCFFPIQLNYHWCFFFHQCVMLQQLCFEWKPRILRKTQIRNDLILLLMGWLDYVSTGITLSHKFLLPYCHHWLCHLGFASIIREMCSIYLPAENVYQYLNCFQRRPGNSCELAAVLDGLFLKMESIHVMFIGKFKLLEYVSLIYIL